MVLCSGLLKETVKNRCRDVGRKVKEGGRKEERKGEREAEREGREHVEI